MIPPTIYNLYMCWDRLKQCICCSVLFCQWQWKFQAQGGPPCQCQVCGGKEWQAAKPGNHTGHTESQRLRSPVTLWRENNQSEASMGLHWLTRGLPVLCLHHQTLNMGGTSTQTLSLHTEKTWSYNIWLSLPLKVRWKLGLRKRFKLKHITVWLVQLCLSVWLRDCVSLQSHFVIDHDWL